MPGDICRQRTVRGGAAQTAQTLASDSVRPQTKEVDDSKPKVEGELNEAPLEDEVLHSDSEGEAEDDGDAQH
jgi:hypothetical protein